MLTISHSPQAVSFQSKKIPKKTVVISNKNGRDYIKDEFIGFHAVRPNLYEVLKDLLESLFRF